jgi:sterol desaturase/sphingolipid hydroxylase (fatty acid hydroxylase superfamily)
MSQVELVVALYVVFGVFEHFGAAEPGHGIKGRLRNILYGVILLGFGGFIAGAVYAAIPFKPMLLETGGPWVTAGRVLLYTFVLDFLFYWFHRAQHRFRWFWEIHELHHADSELNVTTSLRSYWLDRPLQTVFVAFPALYVIGFDSVAMTITTIVTTINLAVTHANLRISFGWLTPVIVGPQLHRIHHSTLPEHQGKNLAQIFPIIDIVFGTYYHPKPGEFPATGTENLTSDAGLIHVHTKPFVTWWEMLRP